MKSWELSDENIIKAVSRGKDEEWRRHQANFTPGSPIAEPSPHHADQSTLAKLKGGLKHTNLQDKYILILLEYKLMLNLALATAYICERRLSGRPAAARAKCSQSQSACEREQSGHYEKKHNTTQQNKPRALPSPSHLVRIGNEAALGRCVSAAPW